MISGDVTDDYSGRNEWRTPGTSYFSTVYKSQVILSQLEFVVSRLGMMMIRMMLEVVMDLILLCEKRESRRKSETTLSPLLLLVSYQHLLSSFSPHVLLSVPGAHPTPSRSQLILFSFSSDATDVCFLETTTDVSDDDADASAVSLQTVDLNFW